MCFRYCCHQPSLLLSAEIKHRCRNSIRDVGTEVGIGRLAESRKLVYGNSRNIDSWFEIKHGVMLEFSDF